MKWPDDYWPKSPAPPSDAAWEASIESFRRDLKAMQQLAADEQIDLLATVPHGRSKRISVRFCSLPITPPTMLANWSRCAGSSESGRREHRRGLFGASRSGACSRRRSRERPSIADPPLPHQTYQTYQTAVTASRSSSRH